MKSKIMITGSCGFIFSNFIRRAIYAKLPYSFVSIDRVNFSDLNSIYWNKNHIFYIADIRDQHVIDTIFKFERPNIVINGAANTHVDNSIVDANSFVTSNILGTQVLINASIKYGVERFIQVSTDEIYGHLENESDPSWKEDSSLNPRNPYAATKLSAELMVKAAHTTHGLNYNITRSSNNYGPRQTPDKLIPKVIKNIKAGLPIPVYGQGLQIRDWTHVYDNCNGIWTVLEKGAPNETYNISANQEFSNIEVVQEICNVMKEGYSLVSFVKDRPGHDFRYSIDSNKLKNLGWSPVIKFKDGIKECVSWYLDNLWFLK